MFTQSYYKDRLGFDPQEALRDGAAVNGGYHNNHSSPSPVYHQNNHQVHNGQKNGGPHDQVYEENLTKFKDERDAIQKKTFTKWVNKHLKKASRHVNDLFEDLRDGLNLISLLEVLSGEHLPREKGRMRFHMLQNVQMTLDFLRYKKIKLVNIRAEDIVDGNPKLTLGLIWTIILHFQISDIVVGQEPNVTAREALLRWARRSTDKYPGVRVSDFTSSWRDGLAFNALIHRNRPDLIDWRNIRNRHVRDRLDTAFHVVEKEYGVTRLLDPEDVDTHEPDEKSLITYISSLYDVFPEPPPMHPLYDTEAQTRATQYRELASHLHLWIREKAALMQDRTFPSTLIEMKKLLNESQRFKNEEVPPKQREKQKLQHVYRELEKYFESLGECDIEPELRPEVLEQNWSRLMMAHQERERDIQEDIRRLERLQRLAEKVHREIKQTDASLDTLERRIDSESRRLDRGAHPAEAKAAAEQAEQALRAADQAIQGLFQDVQVLREGHYSQAHDLHNRVTDLHQRWLGMRADFQARVVARLGGLSAPVQQTTVRRETRTVLETRIADTNKHFTHLLECQEWCRDRLKQLHEADYGHDLPSTQNELDLHQREHKVIDQFHNKVEQCVIARSNFTGEELMLYNQHLGQLQKLYAELLSTSTKRLSDLDALQDFLQSASAELNWLNEKEQVEINRDWADPHINLTAIEEYYEQLMSSLEKRELQFSSVIDRGDALIAQQHPASKIIEAHQQVMQSQWAWVLQLTLCLETHLKHTTEYHNFFQEIKEGEKWMAKREEILNTTFSQSDFTLDQGERLLRGMQELREELNARGEAIARLVARAGAVYPIRARRSTSTKPMRATAVCAYTATGLSLEKGSSCTVVDVSGRSRWRVRGGAGEAQVPSAALALPPPCQEAMDAAQALQERYDRLLALWQRKQLRMRQNMIFATIKVVKGWDLAQFLAMGADQRGAIRRALNEDADKLLREGDPGDPQLRRLRREMEDVNKLFDEFERRARAEEESKNAARIFGEQSSECLSRLDVLERSLHERVAAPMPRDLPNLETLAHQQRAWEAEARQLAAGLDELQTTFRGIALKTPAMKKTLDKVMNKWNNMWSTSALYVERLKCVEIVLTGLDENGQVISEFELKLAQYCDLPNDIDQLKDIHGDLLRLQTAVSQQQIQMDQLNDDAENCRRLVEKSRTCLPHSSLPRATHHADLQRMDRDLDKLNQRWTNVCQQLVDRLRSVEAAHNLLKNYQAGLEKETEWIDDTYSKLQTSPPPEVKPKEDLDKTRQAVEEKYRLCDESINKLLDWVSEMEERLAAQEPAKEDKDELRSQINGIKQIKEEIESQQRAVVNVGEQARQLVVTGGAVLAAREADGLERAARQLKERAERAASKAQGMLRRLQAAWDELAKFSNELTTFNGWLDTSYRTLEDHERALSELGRLGDRTGAARDFLGDVMAHQADLRFITMAAQKFVDESKEYLSALNEFRTSLPSRYPHLALPSDSSVRGQVQLAARRHSDLLARAQKLQDRLRGVGDTRRIYTEALDKANKWMKEIEPQCRAIMTEVVAGEPKAVEAQLARAKSLHNEVLAQSRLIDNAKDACDQLLQTLEGHLTPAEIRSLEVPVIELENKYAQLSSGLGEQCGLLEGALVQSQGLQDALEGQASWINQAENHYKSQLKPASLIRERLDEQLREQKLSQQELLAHRPSLEQVAAAARAVLPTASNARLAAKIDQRMKDVYARYEKLLEKSTKRSEFLEEVSSELNVFSSQASQVEQWCTRLTERTNSSELARLSPEEFQVRIAQLAEERDSKKQVLEECLRNGKQLISKKDVTDTQVVRDRMKGLEVQWKDLNNAMDEKQKLSKQKADQLNQYEKLRAQVVEWLSRMEDKVQRLQPVAVEMEVIKSQQEELRPLHKDYREYGHTIDKINEVGSVYDALVRGDRPDSPHRKRSSQVAYSPTKRPSQASLRNNEARSPSPSKTGLGLVSPLSASGSSGFSSRRSSQEGFHLEEMSAVQQQLCEINNRYQLLGVRLSDRQHELDGVREEVRRHLESLNNLSLFLDKVQRQLPKDAVPNTKEEADKTNKQVRAVLEEMYEKQSLLDSTKSQVKELLRRKAGVLGADRLHDAMEDVSNRWKKLNDACKDKIRMMEEMKDFLDTHDNLVSWLGSKDRMLAALGPISSDSRMVQTQVQQVQVLREELRTQQPQLSHLEEVGTAVLERLEPKSPDYSKVASKLNNVQSRWADLLARLEDRAESLGAAADTSREFDAGLARLRDALQAISDNLDDLPLDKDAEEQLRKIENLERQLEGQRPLLVDLEARGAQLCQVLTDPACRQDIQTKLAQVARQYNNLQKKLDHRKAEQEGTLKDGRQLEESVAKTLGWVQGELSALAGRLLVSADKDKLQQQLDRHGPAYREAMAKEHEVIMLLNKGREMENRPAHPNLRKELDRIQQQWEKLRREVMDRQTRLQTAMEHCKKFCKAQDQFLPWLAQADDKFCKIAPTAFTKKQMEKQLRELQAIRNDVWKKSGEYENNRTLGETFVSACDVDQDIVKDQLSDMKLKWERLNNDLLKKLDWLEEASHRLSDFNDQARDAEHALRRCEDRLGAAQNAPADKRLLDTIAKIDDEAKALEAPIKNLRKLADELSAAAQEAGGDAQHLSEEADGLRDRLGDLFSHLDDTRGKLKNATTAVASFNDQVKGLSLNLADLERDLDGMKAPGRDIKVVRQQLEDLGGFYKRLEDAGALVGEAQKAGEALVDSGFAPDTAQTREQVDSLRKQLGKLDERARAKEQELEDALSKLEAFYQGYDNVMGDIQEASEMVRKMKPVGSEVEQIRAQQKELAGARRDTLEPLAEAVAKTNRAGRGLVQGAGPAVSTQRLEKDLEKMNEAWNDIMDKTNDRERRLDSALLQSGRLREALSGLERWLADTEAMVAAQRPPSADYKVVKAQLQEQKFLNKMLLDRQGSMSSLFAMGGEVAAGCEPAERRAIEQQLKGLVGRFEALTDGAQRRMLDLEQAMRVAKQFQDQLQPLLEWLGTTERKVKALELVPTDEEKIQQRIREHKVIHDDILSKRPDFSQLTETASTLMGLVGEDEASALADRLQAATDRYQALADSSLSAGELLDRSRAALRHLVLTYQELGAWMDAAERRLRRARPLSVHTEQLLRQMDDLAELTEEIASKQEAVDSTVESGLELMKHISGDEALQLKDKLDALQRRYGDLTSKGADLLRIASEALPLVQQFHNSHNKLVDWMAVAEGALQSAEPREQDIIRLEEDLQHYRPLLEAINLVGPQLCQISPGEGAATIEGLVTRDNRRFDAIVEQIQRKAERLHLSKLRSREVGGDMDELLEWFREADERLRNAAPPGCEPPPLRAQLKEHRAFNDDVSGQRARTRDVLSTAKKVLRESQPSEDMSMIRNKMEDLRETMETVGQLSSDRLGILEQALPLAEHFADTHDDLSNWLDDMERQIGMLAMPALRPEQIAQQQDKNEMLIQSINEHKPLVDKLVKTGEALSQLCSEDDAARLQEIAETDCSRYAALRAELRRRQQALEGALQESSLFADKLEGMLRALAGAADQVKSLEPVSAHPPKIEDQIEENNAIVEDLDKREEAYAAVKRAANDVINKASNKGDPAIKDIKKKLDKLNALWSDVQKATSDRSKSLEETLELAKKFWRELTAVMETLHELEESLAAQEPPAAQPQAIQAQQVALQEIRQEIDQTKPEVEQVRKTGSKLMTLCGEPDKPEVKKHIEVLDSAWDNITALYARREENLIDAMEKAMEFHETLQNLLEFLETAEDKFERMGPLGSDIDAVKKQINQLNKFKEEVDPHMVKVEALNRQAQELTSRTSSEQAASIREPLAGVNRRWSALVAGVAERQRELEGALLRLGQFQHALRELMVWIERSDATLDSLKPVAGDPQVLEVELAKLKVLANDIQAHQSSVDTLNDAGQQIIQQGKGTDEASTTTDKLHQLNKKWRELQQKAKDRHQELEEALREAQRFHAEIQDLLSWLGDVDSIIAASKPVGGLPETASEQLERFMEVYNEIEENRPKVEAVLQQGQEYLKKQDRPQSVSNLQHNLKTLKQRWDSVTARASDKKIKLEIALKEATEFHDALQAFVDWLTNAEKVLVSAKPVSRVMETILSQIEEHKSFQKEVSTHRETMLHLDKKGTHLKYFSQKQDVILIKNLLVSVQHRWERVVAKAAERTRALDHGFKEAREFHDQWTSLMNWLNDTERALDELNSEPTVNDPDKIKHRLDRHRDFQKSLGAKQPAYDTTVKCGKQLKDKAPKGDEPVLRQMLSELKSKWTSLCSKSVDRQRKLEEALLFSGQFKDAMSALIEWLRKQENNLREDTPVHGDLDTVMGLVEKHKQLEESLNSRSAQMESVARTGRELEATAPPQDAAQVSAQLSTLNTLWQNVNRLSERKATRLQAALKEAEKLYKSVHMLMEWLSDAETRLRFAGQLPEGDQEALAQLEEHARFMRELKDKERDKDDTLALARAVLAKAHPDAVNVIKQWITIIQSRWEEVSQWALQRQTKLAAHVQSLKDLDLTLEELLQWLMGLENTLLALESEQLPESIELLEGLIQDHKDLMENTQKRQGEVDRVCKANQIKSVGKDSPRKVSTKGATKGQTGKGSQHDLHREREASPDYYGSLNRRQSRASPGRESPDRNLPHYGPRFPPRGSKGAEPEFRSGRVKLLWEKWRGCWLLAWERQRRLHDHLMYLREMEQVRNFSWDDWRKRFLKFMNHKKSRLTDLFRKMDKDNNGLVPRDDFIDGIMNTKFDTFRLEMSAVADLFDRNNLGLIDWQEFIAALRPDWVVRAPETDADKIHDEVKRLVQLCTCRQKFRVFQVGEGKYRFGDSQKLRLVRILRSTVMVRVGGGWVALDEFLVKNDPCRAKGRTNIELREQFILADGVSQSMTAFKSKTPRSSTNTPPALSSAGPITKVRERSARSVPMGARASRSSLSAGTPDSLSDNEASLAQTPRSALRKPSLGRSTLTPGGSRPSSRPSSRAGSKPPSRHGSNMSLDSTDDGAPSRIPLSRRTPLSGTSSGARSALATPRTTPGSTRGGSTSSTRPRTPTSLASPATGRFSGNGMFRTSSIPTLSAAGTLVSKTVSSQPASLGLERPATHSNPIPSVPGSKIPVYVRREDPKVDRSRSESPRRASDIPEVPLQDQTPEEDSSLFNISNISMGSSGSNSNYSISSKQSETGDVPAQAEASNLDRNTRSGSFQSNGQAPGPTMKSSATTSRIPISFRENSNLSNSNTSRPRTPSGSSTPVLPGQVTAASRLFRKGSNASDASGGVGNTTSTTQANGRKTPVRSSATPDRREPFRL